MLPAQQRLDPDDAIAVEGHLGLIVEPHLTGLEAPPEIVLRLVSVVLGLEHVLREHDVAGAAVLLGPPHGGVGPRHALVDIPCAGCRERDPDRGGDQYLTVGQTDRCLEERGDPPTQGPGRSLITDVLAQDDELVASQAGKGGPATADGVARPEPRGEASSHLGQHQVAGVVTELVVDPVEAIDVDDEHRGRRSRANRPTERRGGANREQLPAGQSGQPVVATRALEGELVPRHLAVRRDGRCASCHVVDRSSVEPDRCGVQAPRPDLLRAPAYPGRVILAIKFERLW
jgi:hypothetical protein